MFWVWPEVKVGVINSQCKTGGVAYFATPLRTQVRQGMKLMPLPFSNSINPSIVAPQLVHNSFFSRTADYDRSPGRPQYKTTQKALTFIYSFVEGCLPLDSSRSFSTINFYSAAAAAASVFMPEPTSPCLLSHIRRCFCFIKA